jgi:predicted  nucleic acid-binding Zn-ribbon protein
MKINQINNFKHYINILENKILRLNKNKKYLEYLLYNTNPFKNNIIDILNVYNEINNLENKRKYLNDEYIIGNNNLNENNINIKINIDNLDQQIINLKEKLKNLEKEININK